MNKSAIRWLLAATLLLGAGPGIADGQEKKPAPARALTSDTPEIPVEELKLRLLPLTKAQVEAEVNGWVAKVQETMSKMSEQEIQLLRKPGEAEQIRLEISKLDTERTHRIDRCEIALKSLAAKGGEIKESQTYLASLQGDQLEKFKSMKGASDINRMVKDLRDWALKPEGGIRWATNIILFFLTLFVFRILAWIVGRATRRAVSRSRNISELLRDFFVSTSIKLTKFIGFIVALSFLGVNVGPFVAGIGAIGFIVAFALQGTLSNFASGIMILVYRPYDINDVVSAAGETGKVESMSLVSTTLLTPDNQQIVIPNSSIWGGTIKNVTGKDQRRVDLTFGIGYDDDIVKAQTILNEIVSAHPKVLAEPAPVIKLHELADSSVNFVVRPWTLTADYWDVYWDITRSVKERFDRERISIPYPQQDIHVHQIAAAAATVGSPS